MPRFADPGAHEMVRPDARLRTVLGRSVPSASIGLVLAAVLLVGPARAVSQPTEQSEPPEHGKTEGAGFLADLSFSSPDEPIVVESEQLEFDYDRNTVVYKGDVHVRQGDLKIDTAQLIVIYDSADDLEKARLREVLAVGDVVITQGDRRATGGRAVFSQRARQIVLLDDPVLRDGPNEVRGDKLTIYLDEGRSVVESSTKKRVSAVLYPGSVQGGGGGEEAAGAAEGER